MFNDRFFSHNFKIVYNYIDFFHLLINISSIINVTHQINYNKINYLNLYLQRIQLFSLI